MARPRAEQDGLLLGPNVLTPIAASDSPMRDAASSVASEAAPSKELHSFDADPLQSLSEFHQLGESLLENGSFGEEDGGEKSCLEL